MKQLLFKNKKKREFRTTNSYMDMIQKPNNKRHFIPKSHS